MTTIAFDGKTLAVDSQGSGTFVWPGGFKKLFKHGDRAFAVSGEYETGLMFIDWIMKHGEITGAPSMHKTEVVEVCLKTGVCKTWGAPLALKAPIPYAAGSGADFAVGAMAAGATAVEAVKIAVKYDPFTGGRIRSVSVNEEN